MLICVEGLDGVGKTTITNAIAKEFNLPIAQKPMKKFLELSEEQSKSITQRLYKDYSSDVQALYYLMGYLTVKEDSKKNDLLMDRGFLSTYYFSYNETNKKTFDFFANSYGVPDLTIVLYASIEERISRIKNRDINDADLQKGRIYKDDYSKLLAGIKEYDMPHLFINTEDLTPQEVMDITIKAIKYWLDSPFSKSHIEQFLSIDNPLLLTLTGQTLQQTLDNLFFIRDNNGRSRKKDGNV